MMSGISVFNLCLYFWFQMIFTNHGNLKGKPRVTRCDYRKSRTTLPKDYIASDEWSFFEPARLCTQPKHLFSLKPLDAISSMNAFGSRTHHSCHPGVNSWSRETSLVRVSKEFDLAKFELTKYMTEKWVQLQGSTTSFELAGSSSYPSLSYRGSILIYRFSQG